MENLKKGDIVELRIDKTINLHKGDKFIIIENNSWYQTVKAEMFLSTVELVKIGESQMQYEESNRYKLAQAIKKTGISAKALSRAVAGNECYFYNKTGVARFNKKGDIPDDVLNLALTDLAFAEREVLGIGAKTVEEPSDAEIQMVDLAGAVEEKPKSNKPLFIGASVVISIVLILFILNNYFQVV